MANNTDLKFFELSAIFSLVEMQLDNLVYLTDENENEDQKKFLKNEISKLKPLKTKLNKLIKSY